MKEVELRVCMGGGGSWSPSECLGFGLAVNSHLVLQMLPSAGDVQSSTAVPSVPAANGHSGFFILKLHLFLNLRRKMRSEVVSLPSFVPWDTGMTFWTLHCPDLLNGNIFLLVWFFSSALFSSLEMGASWGFLRFNSLSVLKRINEVMCGFPDCYFLMIETT